jgi:hypothetical protein
MSTVLCHINGNAEFLFFGDFSKDLAAEAVTAKWIFLGSSQGQRITSLFSFLYAFYSIF